MNIPCFVCLGFIWLVFEVKLSGLQQAIPRCMKVRLLFIFLIMQYSTANGREIFVFILLPNPQALCFYASQFFPQKKAAKMLLVGKMNFFVSKTKKTVQNKREKQIPCLITIFKDSSISQHFFHLRSKGRH